MRVHENDFTFVNSLSLSLRDQGGVSFLSFRSGRERYSNWLPILLKKKKLPFYFFLINIFSKIKK